MPNQDADDESEAEAEDDNKDEDEAEGAGVCGDECFGRSNDRPSSFRNRSGMSPTTWMTYISSTAILPLS